MTRERNQRNIRWYAPILVLLMTALTGTDLPAQSAEQFSFDVMPGAVIPLGASTELYEFGFGAGLNGRYLPGNSPFFLGGGVAYGMIPTQAGTSVTLLDAGLGTGVLLQPGQAGLFDVEVGMRRPTEWCGSGSVRRSPLGPEAATATIPISTRPDRLLIRSFRASAHFFRQDGVRERRMNRYAQIWRLVRRHSTGFFPCSTGSTTKTRWARSR